MRLQYAPNPLLIVASETELPVTHSVWGTGGWMMPEEREALDWLTLARLLGWGAEVTRQVPSGAEDSLSGRRWIIIARDPDELGSEFVEHFKKMLVPKPILVIARAGKSDGSFAQLARAARKGKQIAGRDLCWIGPGPEQRWVCGKELCAVPLELTGETEVWATLDGVPIVAARRRGRNVISTLGFHPSEARDADGAATALLKHLLIYGQEKPVAWLDFERTMVLRMDDPGGAQNVYSKSWCYPKLGEAAWEEIGRDLAHRNARLSVAYTSGWVDDGDPCRGSLEVGGQAPERIPGRVYPSPLVKYVDVAGHAPGMTHDYPSEFRGIQKLCAAGLADVELHGYTHMHPDHTAWACAEDRYETVDWYRELGKKAQAVICSRTLDEHPLALGISAFRKYFNAFPTTLISPGDQWTNEILERALALGLRLVDSYYLAIRDGNRFCWTQHVCSPYLDEPDAAWFDAGLPVVGYFHDIDLALEGVAWMSKWLDKWQAAGAKRFMDFRELAAVLDQRLRLDQGKDGFYLTLASEGTLSLVRPLPIFIYFPENSLPEQISFSFKGQNLVLPIHQIGKGLGRMAIPAFSLQENELRPKVD